VAGGTASAGTAPGPATAPQYGTPIPRDEPALNLLTTALPSILKRYGIFLAAGAVVIWLASRLLGKRKSS
jgi:hypothetical protein